MGLLNTSRNLSMADTSGADNTQLGDVTIFDSAYYNQDYKLQAIWLGLVWFALGVMPQIIYSAARPWVRQIGLTGGEWHAWRVMLYGNGNAFYVLTLFWLLAYIKAPKPDRIMSKIYYRAIAWIIPISWI